MLFRHHFPKSMRLGNIFLAILELTRASESNYVDPNCPLKCNSKCDDQYLQCISSCIETDCFFGCNRDSVACVESCPCRTDCIEGCSGCENPICSSCNDASNDYNIEACVSKNSMTLGQCILNCDDDGDCESSCVRNFKEGHAECPCQVNCPQGCPCENYQCDHSDKKAILTLHFLNEYDPRMSPPVLIQPDGGVTENFEFTINDDAEVGGSCSAMLNGELYFIGGVNKRNQLSKVSGCELGRIDDLSFDVANGRCGTFRFPEERIFLCYMDFNGVSDQCQSFDGTVFHDHVNSTYLHGGTTMANYREAPMAVGGFANYESNSESGGIPYAEIFNIANNTWNVIADYPFHSEIRFYATVTTSKGALIIGGMVELVEVRTVGAYNDDGWKKLNDLQAPRLGHRAIVNGDKVFVIGGLRKQYTEIWSDKNGTKKIELAEPQLVDHFDYPELALVDTNFCVRR